MMKKFSEISPLKVTENLFRLIVDVPGLEKTKKAAMLWLQLIGFGG